MKHYVKIQYGFRAGNPAPLLYLSAQRLKRARRSLLPLWLLVPMWVGVIAWVAWKVRLLG